MKKTLTSLLSLFSIFCVSCASDIRHVAKTIKELRNPDGLSHSVSYNELMDEGYKTFKNKLKTLSIKLSDSFVDREFDEKGNITFSPLSIELCLGLAVEGSNNQTRDELLNVFDVDYPTFKQYYKTFFN